MKIFVVGGGMQGRVIAENLASRKERPEIVVLDINEPARLPSGVQFRKANVLDEKQICSEVANADAVVLAVPSEIAKAALSNLIKSGRPIVDVSFTPDPPLDLDECARASGSVCLVDCGVSPGFSNILLGRAIAELGGADSLKILVGGMPQNPPAVFKHAIYFNPNDLIAEYVRPARARTNGADIAPSPLDVDFVPLSDSELGNLEMFASDGLRSLLTSYPNIPEMTELTIRWPGHLDAMKTMRDVGLFDDVATSANIARVLNEKYPEQKYPDYLLLLLEVKKGKETRSWRMLDRHTNGLSAMSRTTGFTTAAVAMLLAGKHFTEPGVHPPERLGAQEGLAQMVVDDLSERGVKIAEIGSEVLC